jgi:O-antigen/teichoic acid export membrane protein
VWIERGNEQVTNTLKSPKTLVKILQNIFALALADIVNKILLFFFFILSARYLGPSDFGRFSLAMAIMNILVVLADFGTSVLGTRELARNYKTTKMFLSNVAFFKTIYSVFLAIGTWFGLRALGFPPDKILTTSLLFPAVIFFTFTQSFNAVFQATEMMFYIPLGKFIEGSILISGAYLFARLKIGTNGFIGLYTIGVFSVFIFSLVIIWNKFTRFTVAYDLDFLKQILKEAFPFAVGMIFSTLYYWNGSALLSLWKGDQEAGIFTAPLRLVLGMTVIPAAFVGSIYPSLSRTFIQAKEEMENLLEKALKYVLIIAVPLCIFGFVLAHKIIQVFYGYNYISSAPLLKILIWWAGLIYLNAVFVHFFYSRNQQSVVAKQTFIALILNIILNLLLIKKFGALGASIAIVSAEFISFIYLFLNTLSLNQSHKTIARRLAIIFLKSILAFLPALSFIILGKTINIIVLFILTLILYAAFLYGLKGISTSDLELIKTLLKDLRLIIYGKI